MDFGAIIGFIAIAIISSLFNKDKKSIKPTVRPNRPISSETPVKRVDPNQNRRKNFSGGLEDLFKEIKVEFDKTFRDTQKEQSYSSIQENIVKENSSEKGNRGRLSKNTLRDDTKKAKNSVYEGEIGKEEIPIEFNRKSIIQGVIMSEILQKPKSLRR